MTPERLAALWLGLAAGNALFAALVSGDWRAAADRSFFQAVALLAALWVFRP